MSADKSAENTLNFQPNLSAQAQNFGIFEKKSLWVSVVRDYEHLFRLVGVPDKAKVFSYIDDLCFY